MYIYIYIYNMYIYMGEKKILPTEKGRFAWFWCVRINFSRSENNFDDLIISRESEFCAASIARIFTSIFGTPILLEDDLCFCFPEKYSRSN